MLFFAFTPPCPPAANATTHSAVRNALPTLTVRRSDFTFERYLCRGARSTGCTQVIDMIQLFYRVTDSRLQLEAVEDFGQEPKSSFFPGQRRSCRSALTRTQLQDVRRRAT